MSSTEHYKGVAVKVDTGEMKTEEYIVSLLKYKGVETNSPYDDIYDYYPDEYVVVDEYLYKIEEKIWHDEEDDIAMALNVSGKIMYEVRYYNGGSDFEEMFGEAIRNMK